MARWLLTLLTSSQATFPLRLLSPFHWCMGLAALRRAVCAVSLPYACAMRACIRLNASMPCPSPAFLTLTYMSLHLSVNIPMLPSLACSHEFSNTCYSTPSGGIAPSPTPLLVIAASCLSHMIEDNAWHCIMESFFELTVLNVSHDLKPVVGISPYTALPSAVVCSLQTRKSYDSIAVFVVHGLELLERNPDFVSNRQRECLITLRVVQ